MITLVHVGWIWGGLLLGLMVFAVADLYGLNDWLERRTGDPNLPLRVRPVRSRAVSFPSDPRPGSAPSSPPVPFENGTAGGEETAAGREGKVSDGDGSDREGKDAARPSPPLSL